MNTTKITQSNVLAVTPKAGLGAVFKAFKGASATRQSKSLSSNRASRNAVRLNAMPVVASATPVVAATQTATPMDIVFVSTEVSPWSKTGGLGDVVGSLPVELAKRGHNVFTIAPRFDQFADAWDTSVVINVDGEDVRFFHTVKQGVHRVWIDHPWFLAKVWGPTGSKLYGQKSGSDFADNPKRFSLFCKAAIESLKAIPFMPGEDAVVVCNDWHTALVPVLLKDYYQPKGEFKDTKCALTVHNIAFQGRFWPETFADMGLPEISKKRFEFSDGYPKVFDETNPADEPSPAAPGQKFAKLNWLQAGIDACDKLLTVSPNYATEMSASPAGGVELDKIIKAKGVEGIVNGMDVAEWNPALDKFLAFKYNEETVEAGKAYAKAALQREVGLDVDPKIPLFGFIGRLEEQKGVDILIAALAKLPKDAKIQVAVLGTGKAEMEAAVRNLSNQLPGIASGLVIFSAPLAHLITAGADFMLVPSRFEPCGLVQLHAASYGTVPLVASTGGLVDTIKEGVTGFQMGAFDLDALLDEDADAIVTTMMRAASIYGTPKYDAMRDACIAQDLSWAKPAQKWEAVLAELKWGVKLAEQKATIPTPVEKLDNPGAYPDDEAKPSYIAEVIANANKKASSAATSAAAAAPAPVSAKASSSAVVTAVKQATATSPATSPAAQTYAAAYSAKPSAVASKEAAVASVNKAPAPAPPKPAAANGAAKPAANGTAKAAAAAPAAAKGASAAAPKAAAPAAAAAKTTTPKKPSA